ncbi:MAG: hypothetical protein WDW38_010846 [Sanguina aurantia]
MHLPRNMRTHEEDPPKNSLDPSRGSPSQSGFGSTNIMAGVFRGSSLEPALSGAFKALELAAGPARATASMSGKGVKGGKGPPMGRPGAPIPGAKVVAAVPVTPVMETVKKPITFLGTAIVKKWPNRMDSLALLTEEQQQLGQRILPQPPPPPGDAAADASAPPAIPAVLRDFKQLGLPLDSRDITSLVHQSLSNAMGQHTHLRPFIFTNIFQSAPVVATYVASAMEAGYQWSRVERFFLSSIEMEDSIRGIKVQLLNTPRKPLPYHSSSAWWNTPGPLQPLENCSWQAFSKGYDPTKHSVEEFLAQQQAAVKTFPNSEERALYLLDKSEGSSQPQAPLA